MTELVHVKSDASIEEILEIIDRDAGIIIDDLLPKKLLSKIKSQLSPYLKDSVSHIPLQDAHQSG